MYTGGARNAEAAGLPPPDAAWKPTMPSTWHSTLDGHQILDRRCFYAVGRVPLDDRPGLALDLLIADLGARAHRCAWCCCLLASVTADLPLPRWWHWQKPVPHLRPINFPRCHGDRHQATLQCRSGTNGRTVVVAAGEYLAGGSIHPLAVHHTVVTENVAVMAISYAALHFGSYKKRQPHLCII